MTWHSILKADKALVGRKAKNPNLFLQRKGTAQNLGRPMKSKPKKLSFISIEVPKEEFTRYFNFLAEFYSNRGWEQYSMGSLQQGIRNDVVERVLRDFERGKLKDSKRKYSDELDATAKEMMESLIKKLKMTGELLQKISRTHIREGRDMVRYAEKLERSYDIGRKLKKADPKTGTGKKPKGSARRLYTDENPKDTVPVKFRTAKDVRETFSSSAFKKKPHKRQSQIINLVEQRARVASTRAKDPEAKKRLKSAHSVALARKEASKRKTQRMRT